MFEIGDKVIIGNEKASRFNYRQIVGKECIYMGQYYGSTADTHQVIYGTGCQWYVQGIDVLPYKFDNNESAAKRLLKGNG